MKYESKISFLWDEDYLMSLGHIFKDGGEATDFIQDTTIDMIKKAIETNYIHNIVKVQIIDELK